MKAPTGNVLPLKDPARPDLRRKETMIIAQRANLICEIGILRQRLGSSSTLDKAQALLTRWWSQANWNSRQHLLKSAVWLLDIAAQGGGEEQVARGKNGKPKRGGRPLL